MATLETLATALSTATQGAPCSQPQSSATLVYLQLTTAPCSRLSSETSQLHGYARTTPAHSLSSRLHQNSMIQLRLLQVDIDNQRTPFFLIAVLFSPPSPNPCFFQSHLLHSSTLLCIIFHFVFHFSFTRFRSRPTKTEKKQRPRALSLRQTEKEDHM